MKELIVQRTLNEARYILQHKCTVRDAAKIFFISKSTLHKDVTVRLRYVDKRMYEEVKKVLDFNLAQRHLRGGNATKKMYESKKAKE
jgi:putative DeoR family transcriptional regulator (stage III sporulation protein D)